MGILGGWVLIRSATWYLEDGAHFLFFEEADFKVWSNVIQFLYLSAFFFFDLDQLSGRNWIRKQRKMAVQLPDLNILKRRVQHSPKELNDPNTKKLIT